MVEKYIVNHNARRRPVSEHYASPACSLQKSKVGLYYSAL